jgi:branched-chain amino acid transport system substrate-binding protein
MAVGMAAALLAGSCSTDEPEILVGAIYPTGGSQGMGGIDEYRGLLLAADLANEEGGVNGRRVRILLEPADTAEAAPGAVERLAASGVTVVAGTYGSTISRPVAEAATRRDLVFWETGAVGDLSPVAALGESVFRFAPTGASLGGAAAAFVRDQLMPLLDPGAEPRYSVVYVDDVYGRSVGLGAIEEIERSGLRLAGGFPYDLATVDYVALADRIAAAGTDVLVVAAYLDDGVDIRRAVLRRDVPLIAMIGTSSSYCMPEFGRIMGRQAVGVFASDKPDGDVIDPAALAPPAAAALRWAREEFRARYDDPMSAAALSGFAGGWALFHHVLPEAAGLSPDSVAGAIRAVRLPVGSLPNGAGLEFAPPGHEGAGANLRATSVIWEWVDVGTRVIVWPPSFATADIEPISG